MQRAGKHRLGYTVIEGVANNDTILLFRFSLKIDIDTDSIWIHCSYILKCNLLSNIQLGLYFVPNLHFSDETVLCLC